MNSIDIRYGSELHTRLRQAVRDRQRLSERKMNSYYDKWEEAEKRFTAYRKETENDQIRDNLRDDGKPQFTTIEIPYSYAMLMTAQTYWTTVFLGRSPVFQFSARHGEGMMKVQGMEALIDYQVNVGEQLVPLYLWLLDQGKYGLGVLCNYWDKEEVVVSEIEERPVTYLGIPVEGKTEKVRVSKRITGYQGNKLFNVRPYDFFPDPRVPVLELQRGEFCARRVTWSWNDLLRGQDKGRYQNIERLKMMARVRQNKVGDYSTGDDGDDFGTPDQEFPAKNETADELDIGYTDGVEMIIELSPKEWKLGTSSYPEKWVFSLAADEIIIEARPFGAYHGKFPYFVQEYEQDAYQLVPRSMPEIIEPLNDTMTWLLNSHFHNVRKVINDQVVYDPSRIVSKDLSDPAAGRLIRLRPEAYGTDPKLALFQLQSVDVTANHLKDAMVVADLMQRVTGVSDNVMGQVNPGGRKTATEIRSSNSFGTNRLKMNCEYNSALGWAPLSQVMVQNTQQYYDGEQMFKVAGNMLAQEQHMMITPETIQGFFDYVPVDGTLPIDNFAMANLWKELMASLVKMPQLGMTYDLGAIFAYTARLAGAKNIDQFKVQVRPDEQLAAQAQAGNLVPIGGQQRGRPQTRGSAGAAPSGPIASPVGGVGPTG